MSIAEKPEIKNIDLHLLHNDAHFQLMTEFRDLVLIKTPEALRIEAQWPAFLSKYANLDAALKKIPKSALTDAIKAADAARDAAFTGINKFNKAILDYHYDSDWHEAARQIDIVLRTYGNVAAKPINEETSAVYNLVQELRSEKYRAHVSLIGLMPWVNKLDVFNNSFEGLIQERDRESESKSHISMKPARHDMDDTYKNIVKTVNSLIFLGQITAYETFVDTYNIVVNRYITAIKHQQSGHRHHGTGAGSDGPDGTDGSDAESGAGE
jgi:hypothetical protein